MPAKPPKDLQVDFIEIDGQELAVITLPARAQSPSLDGLSAAEREVVQAVLAGKSNVDIARARGTSARTVANQLASIYGKLGISSRHELVALTRTNEASKVDVELEEAILELLSERERDGTICPSEAARRVGGEAEFRALMEPARAAARRLVARGEIVITQHGRVVDPSTARGPIRLRRAP